MYANIFYDFNDIKSLGLIIGVVKEQLRKSQINE
jgi:hypothetical protein|tara:strand:+ start:2090 stop:2191 length:102 start_codon:yes stop_codon:yes gene_type:complete